VSARIPDEAFDFYVGLGPSRSYRAVADRYGVSKRAVVKHALREKWADRLREIQEKARAESDKDLAEEMAEMHARHKKMLRAMAVRALAGLKELQLRSGMEAIRAGELVIRMERIVFGEPEEHGADSIEEITKREIQTLLKVADEEEEEDDDDDDEEGPPVPEDPKPDDDQGGGHAPAQ
jgi:hypothetical protein